MNIFTPSAVVETETPELSLTQQFEQADRLYRASEDAITAALARLRECTQAHRAAGDEWCHSMEIRNRRLKERSDLLERIRKQEAES